MLKYQQNIQKEFPELIWEKKDVKNECNIMKKLTFNNTQKFLYDFFERSNPMKGMLLYHSVGAGKTCSGTIISANFKGYKIMWVTAPSLKSSVTKNIFGNNSCHFDVIENREMFEGVNDRTKRMRFKTLTNKSWYPILSYKQFYSTIMNPDRNKLSREIYGRNKDPLYKTLIIIDEAHNLFDYVLDRDAFAKIIENSYKLSGNDSVRLLFMTATPLLNGYKNFIDMMNLIKPQLGKIRDFQVDKLFTMKKNQTLLTEEGKQQFKKYGKHISYLDISDDKNIFAQPNIMSKEIIYSTMRDEVKKVNDKLENIKNKENNIKQISKIIREFLSSKENKLPIDMNITTIANLFPEIDISILKHLFRTHNNLISCTTKECTKRLKEIEVSLSKTFFDDIKKKKENIKNEIKSVKLENKITNKKNKRVPGTMILECNKEELPNRKIKCYNKAITGTKIKSSYRFEHPEFNQSELINLINNEEHVFAKIKMLFDTIDDVDKKDLKEHNKKYKHAIYVKNRSYLESGVKMLISAFIAKGLNFPYKLAKKIKKDGTELQTLQYENNITGNNNFVALTLASFFRGRKFSKNELRRIVNDFNKRPDNTHGQNIRFIIFDDDHTEGIDLFDIKYLHVFDTHIKFDKFEQVKGRGTRTCGQKGLTFIENKGWILQVLKYNEFLFNNKNNFSRSRFNANPLNKNEHKNNIIRNHIEQLSVDKLLTTKLSKDEKDKLVKKLKKEYDEEKALKQKNIELLNKIRNQTITPTPVKESTPKKKTPTPIKEPIPKKKTPTPVKEPTPKKKTPLAVKAFGIIKKVLKKEKKIDTPIKSESISMSSLDKLIESNPSVSISRSSLDRIINKDSVTPLQNINKKVDSIVNSSSIESMLSETPISKSRLEKLIYITPDKTESPDFSEQFLFDSFDKDKIKKSSIKPFISLEKNVSPIIFNKKFNIDEIRTVSPLKISKKIQSEKSINLSTNRLNEILNDYKRTSPLYNPIKSVIEQKISPIKLPSLKQKTQTPIKEPILKQKTPTPKKKTTSKQKTPTPVKESTPKKKTPTPVKEPTPKKKTTPKQKTPTPVKEPTPKKKTTPKQKTPTPVKEPTPKKKTPTPVKEPTPKKKTPTPVKEPTPKKKEELDPELENILDKLRDNADKIRNDFINVKTQYDIDLNNYEKNKLLCKINTILINKKYTNYYGLTRFKNYIRRKLKYTFKNKDLSFDDIINKCDPTLKPPKTKKTKSPIQKKISVRKKVIPKPLTPKNSFELYEDPAYFRFADSANIAPTYDLRESSPIVNYVKGEKRSIPTKEKKLKLYKDEDIVESIDKKHEYDDFGWYIT
jgi:hypothetical protein